LYQIAVYYKHFRELVKRAISSARSTQHQHTTVFEARVRTMTASRQMWSMLFIAWLRLTPAPAGVDVSRIQLGTIIQGSTATPTTEPRPIGAFS
jgi:hypothetical protein